MIPLTDPEGAFVGALLHLPARVVVEALALVRAEDVADPRLGLAADVCGDLADRGVDPHPTAVFAHVRAGALVTGADALREFSLLLADLYGAAPTPAGWRFLAAGVLDEALRRRCTELADRVMQAADGAPLDTLVDVLDSECRAVRAVLHRRAVAGEDNDAPVRLTEVTAA